MHKIVYFNILNNNKSIRYLSIDNVAVQKVDDVTNRIYMINPKEEAIRSESNLNILATVESMRRPNTSVDAVRIKESNL